MNILKISSFFFFLSYLSSIAMDNKIVIHGLSYNTDNEQENFTTPFQRNSAYNFIPPERKSLALPQVNVDVISTALQTCASIEQAYLMPQLNTCIDLLSQANVAESISSILALDDFKFQHLISNELSLEYQYYYDRTIDQLNYLLYDKTGSLRLEPIPTQNYEAAKIITHEFLQKIRPHDYVKIVEDLAQQQRPGFIEVYQELTQKGLGSFFRTLGRGVLTCFSLQGSPITLRQLIKENDVRKDLLKIKECGEQFKFFQVKEIVEKYNNGQSAYNKKIAAAAQKLYCEYLEKAYDFLVKKLNLTSSQELKKELSELIPYIAENHAQAIELFYEKLERNKHDENKYSLLQQLIKKNGLPKFYGYDHSRLDGVEIPSCIVGSNHIKEQRLLFSFMASPTQDKTAVILGARYIAKTCKTGQACYSRYAETILHSLQSQAGDKTFLSCTDFTQEFDIKTKEEMVRRIVPAICNLTYEINQLRLQQGSEVRIEHLKELLLKLDTSFKALNDAAPTQIAFNQAIREVLHELNALNRSDMILTKSQENLRALRQSVDLLYTGKTESHNVQVLQKLQPQSTQIQPDLSKVYEQYLMRETLDNEGLWTKANDSLRYEVIAQYIASSQDEALQEIETIILNRDTNCIIAENISTVIQDSVIILATDFPLKEIGDYAYETITNPTAYVANIAKDFAQLGHFLKSFVSDYANNNITSLGASKKDAYKFSKKYNEAVHKFAENWKSLSAEHKKEFVAQLIVDLAANKALGSGAKLISKVMGDCIISFIETLPPSISGSGAAAITQDFALMPELAVEVAEAIQAGGEILGSTPFAIGTTGISSTVHMMARRENVIPIHAEGSPDYLEKCVKLKSVVDQPIESISDAKIVIHQVPLTSENKLIKEFNIKKNHYGHMFSKAHLVDGITNLGTDQLNIMEKCTNIILDLDRQGLLVEKGVQIETVINGLDTTVRVHIIDNKILFVNGFIGYSNDVLGKLIKYTYKGL